MQGYNAQAVVGEAQIIRAAEISIESLDTANLAPMIQTAIGELEAVGVPETRGVVLADAGSWTKNKEPKAHFRQTTTGFGIVVEGQRHRNSDDRKEHYIV